jgi:hypothetical protein
MLTQDPYEENCTSYYSVLRNHMRLVVRSNCSVLMSCCRMLPVQHLGVSPMHGWLWSNEEVQEWLHMTPKECSQYWNASTCIEHNRDYDEESCTEHTCTKLACKRICIFHWIHSDSYKNIWTVNNNTFCFATIDKVFIK